MKVILPLLLLLISVTAFPQNKTKKICGEYTYYPPANVSLEEAKQVAVEQAKLKALADEFGTILSQANTSVIENSEKESKIDFKSIRASEVKGEWLENTGEPSLQVSYEQGMLIVKASVCGKAREITRAGTSFTAKTLCNGTEDKYESGNFNEGDDFFVSFQSPVNGFIAIYLIDDEQNAYCLLPYNQDENGQVSIKHGQRYVFFDSASADENERNKVDELTMSCAKTIEHNELYIIFSPNSFIKANDNQLDKKLPRQLSFNDFQKWLTKNRNVDQNMQVEKKVIKVEKK